MVASTNDRAYTQSFVSGADGTTESTVVLGDMIRAYDQFKNAEDVDVSLILTGKSSSTHGVRGMGLAKYIIENIAEFRKDCVVFTSPQNSDVVNNPFQEMEDSILTRDEIGSSSYGVFDSGYKWQYDKYLDTYHWIPLNGDIAGLAARTDDLRDPWYSPAGFNRGNIKNVTKLAYNPDKADRDLLYKSNVNPVVNFPGLGTVLYGDKTLLTKPSAFDRINVRRLFIVLEKAISTAAKFSLFEFNDEFTRAQFRNLVEPYLRDVQGRRGIYDFTVVCDETNNTGEVIDRNEFVGDIYIKPARSINYIQLNFIAVRTGVEFSEVVGQFG
jgi:phage tail sheath protein FI